jgi:nicotinamide-nucleotide amidase
MDTISGKTLNILGISPAGVKKRLRDRGMEKNDLNYAANAYGTVISSGESSLTDVFRAIEESFSPFTCSGNRTPAQVLINSAVQASALLVFAESCTGGLAGSLVTGIAGSSDVFWGSMVTYANEAKERVLGVSTIGEHGAVSEETVKAMAVGAMKVSDANAALAVSGIAGPGGGTPDKPVGTVWFAFKFLEQMQTLKCVFSGSRAQVRRKAAGVALAGLANQINGALLDTAWIADYTWY